MPIPTVLPPVGVEANPVTDHRGLAKVGLPKERIAANWQRIGFRGVAWSVFDDMPAEHEETGER